MHILLQLSGAQDRPAQVPGRRSPRRPPGRRVGGLGFFTRPLAAAQLKKDQKRVVLFNMHGGLSQLESWDPKPGTETGGPFRAISTSVPGIQISELLPNVARQMHHLCLVRGVNTSEDDHGKGAYLMTTGPQANPRRRIPDLRGRLRQGDGPRRQRAPRPHRDHARRRRRPRQRRRLPGPQVLEHRAWATATRPSTPSGPET